MDTPFARAAPALVTTYQPWVVVLSYFIASYASYVALDLAKRVRGHDNSVARGWWAGGSVAMGTGIWSMHFVGMLALSLPFEVGYGYVVTALSWVAAVGVSAVALFIASRQRLSVTSLAAGALSMGIGICLMHYTGMAAASFDSTSLCLSVDQLGGESLGMLVAVASCTLLTFTIVTSTIDARMQTKTARLAASLKSANTELQQLAFRDALTGLPNRLLFDDRVSSAVDRCTRDGTRLAVLFVDLDGFKPVNDSFGHAFGDGVLRDMAARISAGARATDTVARVGGDEFVLLIEGDPDTTAAAQIAQTLIDALTVPVNFKDHEVRLSCSVGIALFPSDGPREQLMAHADAAMYAAKRAGGATYAFFEPHMNAGVREQLELQTDLRNAIQQGGELELFYQPKIGAAGGRITGAEALVRWRHPQRGLLSPGLFIPVAERFGLIGALGYWVIEEACRQMRVWLDEGLRVRVAINLSVHQLRQDDLVPRIEKALERHRLDPALLTFEITESVAMEDAESTLRVFERLGRIGVRVSIDDFGTGYSSLSYLRQLRTSELKIDRSFVQDLETSADARAIVKAVVKLAHSLGLKVVAEGVETAAQRDVLKDLHCDELQGFLFAKPMPPGVMSLWASDIDRPVHLNFADSSFVEV